MKKGVLHVMIGIPASGKSTIAGYICREEGAIWLSSDKIREELYGDEAVQGDGQIVFSLLFERTKNALKEGKAVVYDATCLYEEVRKDLLSSLNGTYESAYCHFCDVELETALERNSKRNREVPEDVIKRMFRNMQRPSDSEGFDMVYIYES